MVTLLDREIAGMRLALEALPATPFLLLYDSEAAIATVRNPLVCA